MGWARQLRSGRWQPQYRDPSGKVRATGETFLKERDATKAADAKEAEVRAGLWRDPSRGKDAFEDHAHVWLETKRRRKPKTFTDYELVTRLHLIPYFGRRPLRSVDRTQVQAWVTWMEENGRGPAVVLKAFRVLRAIFNDAVYSEKLDRSPVFKIELPEPPRRAPLRITPEDVTTLASAIHERYRVAVLMGGMLGLRWAEVAGLQHMDLDLDAGVAVIRHTLSEDKGLLHFTDTKNHRPKVVPLPPMLCRLLDEHIARFGADHDARASVYVDGRKTAIPTASFVFTTEEGCLLRRNIYTDHFRPAVTKAGLPPKLTFHALRKAAGSIAASPTYAGASPKTVQNLLGHSVQQVTTETYVAEFAEDTARLRASLERIYSEAGPAVHLQCNPDLTVTSIAPRRRRKAG